MEPCVGIVLVNYNGEKFQNDCIRSIKRMNYFNYKIIVVDNNSTDDSVKKLEQEFKDIYIIRNHSNEGVARGNNIGIKYALDKKCDLVLLLNNDTEVHEDMLKNMIQKAQKYDLVTCKMYYYMPNNIIWCAGGKINWKQATTIHFSNGDTDNDFNNESRIVEYAPTCCLLINKKVFQDIGLMDENYFIYYDDTDFLLRCNRKGYKLWYESSARLWHKVSSSSGGGMSKTYVYYINRNKMYFVDKNYGKGRLFTKFIIYVDFIKFVIKTILNRKDLIGVLLRAINDYNAGKMAYQDLSKL